VEYFIEIFRFDDLFGNKLIFLIESLNGFEIVFNSLAIDGLIIIFGLIVLLEGMLNETVFGLYFLLHILADRVL
jgi:hypothetical protein